jgi:hypothetical protein
MALIDEPYRPRHGRRTTPVALAGTVRHRAGAEPRGRLRQVCLIEIGDRAAIRVAAFVETAAQAGPAVDVAGVFAAMAAEITAAFDELAGVRR